eukprot:PhM_4_TR15576/c0_g1_i1/m.3206
MSRKRAEKEPPKPSIQTLPRYDVTKDDDDGLERSKWVEDYDRIQDELLKPVIAHAACVSLRTFDEKGNASPARQNNASSSDVALSDPTPAINHKASRSRRGSAVGLSTAVSPSGPASPIGLPSINQRASMHTSFDKMSSLRGAKGASSEFTSRNASLSKQRSSRFLRSGDDVSFSADSAAHPRSHTTSPARRLDYSALSSQGTKSRAFSPTSSNGASGGALDLTMGHNLGEPSPAEIAALCTLIGPRDAFKGKVALDTRHLDLSWLKGEENVTRLLASRSMMTLENLKEDTYILFGKKSKATLIDSPRSILTLFRTGTTVQQLLREPPKSGTLVGVDVLPARAATSMSTTSLSPSKLSDRLAEALETERKATTDHVRQHYREVCQAMSLQDVANAVISRMHEVVVLMSSATCLQQQKERQEQVIRANRIKLEKQAQMQEEAEHRVTLAHRKREEIEKERQQALEQQRREAQRRAQEVQERMDHMKEQTALAAEEALRKAAERRRELERRDQELKDSLARHREMKKQKAIDARENKELKIRAARERLDMMQEERQMLVEQKSIKAQLRKEELDARKMEEMEGRWERAEQVRQQREAARQRNHEAERLAQERAAERRRQVEERLDAFAMCREQSRMERQELEQKKAQERRETQERSTHIIEQRKEDMLSRLAVVADKQEQIQQQKEEQLIENALRTKLDREQKRRQVERQRQVDEFRKLLLLDTLQRRQDKIEATEHQREIAHKQLLAMRDQMRMEVEAVRETPNR